MNKQNGRSINQWQQHDLDSQQSSNYKLCQHETLINCPETSTKNKNSTKIKNLVKVKWINVTSYCNKQPLAQNHNYTVESYNLGIFAFEK